MFVHRTRARDVTRGVADGRALLGTGPGASAKVEELIDELRADHAIVIVTHSMQQAARASQRVAYFYLGKRLETGDTTEVMLRPRNRRCADYLTGRCG